MLSIVLAVIATLLLQYSQQASISHFDIVPFLIIFVACFSASLLSPAINIAGGISPTGNKKEQGKVKWFNASKGYGFITKASGEEVFVHFRSIKGKGRKVLREGQQVKFIETVGDKGPQAEDVELIK